MNQLYNQLNRVNQAVSSPNNLGQIKQMMNLVRSASNPNAMLNNLMQQNPQVGQVMQLIQQGGGDPKTVFYKLAEQKGVDPNEVLNALK